MDRRRPSDDVSHRPRSQWHFSAGAISRPNLVLPKTAGTITLPPASVTTSGHSLRVSDSNAGDIITVTDDAAGNVSVTITDGAGATTVASGSGTGISNVRVSASGGGDTINYN